MGELFYKDKRFIYTEQGRERILLDCSAYLSNKSRMPMHCLKHQRLYTIPDFLGDLIEKGPYSGSEKGLGAALIDVLMAARLIRTSQPVRALEYGCLGGKLSFHMAEVLGTFCEESSLVCACDTMDMEWMDVISGVEKLPQISFLAGDYGHLQLQPGYFDVILINGTVNFADPCQVVSDALKLAAEDGVILCYCDDTPLLENVFKLFFDVGKREDYVLSSVSKLMTARAGDSSWRTWEEEYDFDGRAKEHLRQAEKMILKGSVEKREAMELTGIMLKEAKTAGAKGNVELKLQLLRQKEKLVAAVQTGTTLDCTMVRI